jgi:hypothetical protein
MRESRLNIPRFFRLVVRIALLSARGRFLCSASNQTRYDKTLITATVNFEHKPDCSLALVFAVREAKDGQH